MVLQGHTIRGGWGGNGAGGTPLQSLHCTAGGSWSPLSWTWGTWSEEHTEATGPVGGSWGGWSQLQGLPSGPCLLFPAEAQESTGTCQPPPASPLLRTLLPLPMGWCDLGLCGLSWDTGERLIARSARGDSDSVGWSKPRESAS